MTSPAHRSREELVTSLPSIRAAPPDRGRLELIARRPGPERREVVERAELDPEVGLRGDSWLERGSRHTEDGAAEPERQLTLMSSRAAAAIAGDRHHWALAGDQLYLDLDLGSANLPAGSTLRIGAALVEVSAAPHAGCAKFTRRFGRDAARFVNSAEGRALNLRGVNARVTEPGAVSRGDAVVVVSRPGDA